MEGAGKCQGAGAILSFRDDEPWLTGTRGRTGGMDLGLQHQNSAEAAQENDFLLPYASNNGSNPLSLFSSVR